MKEKIEMPKSIPKYSSKTGRPLLLGEIGEMVQAYITRDKYSRSKGS